MSDIDTEHSPPLNYDQIISVAKTKAAELKGALPALPSKKDLGPFEGRMWATDRRLIDVARRHLDEWGVAHGHDYDKHIEWVAVNSAYVAAVECDERDIRGDLRDEIIQRTWRMGLLHDLQRWRGWQNTHAIEGMKATKQKLQELGIDDPYLLDQVFLHDRKNVQRRNDPRFDIPFFSVFAVDHLVWGRVWEETRWQGLATKGVLPEEAIHDYQFMLDLKNSPNLQQTRWGKEVAIPYVDFGIAVVKHVERVFSDSKPSPPTPKGSK